ncbi:MAG: antibiotic biosynthesis monooxygenase [Rhizobacter sp.]|nr:antibiotic biosynthesis monooxygenase [Rhizobacter sp.]
MIVVRFKMQCKADRAEQLCTALAAVARASQSVDGVVSFDIGSDLTDPNSFIATEVFADRSALTRQEALPEVASVMKLLPEALAAEPEATIYNVSSSEPWSG